MMVDPSGYWPKWLKATITVAAVVGVVALAVGVSVATGGAGSVAATIAITYAIGVVSNVAEVAVAQGKKSKADGDSNKEMWDDIIESTNKNLEKIITQKTGGKTLGYMSPAAIETLKFGNSIRGVSLAQTKDIMMLETGYTLKSKLLSVGTETAKYRVTNFSAIMYAKATPTGLAISYGFAAMNVALLGRTIFSEPDYNKWDLR